MQREREREIGEQKIDNALARAAYGVRYVLPGTMTLVVPRCVIQCKVFRVHTRSPLHVMLFFSPSF